VTEDIPDYQFVTSDVAGELMTPNNTKAEWIENLKPNFCPVTCQFLDSLTSSEQYLLPGTTAAGSYDLSLNRTDVWNIEGHVRCIYEHPTSGLKIRRYSNDFRMVIEPPFNNPPEFKPPSDVQMFVNETETIPFGLLADKDVFDIPYFHLVEIEPVPNGGFISFINETGNETITIDPLSDEANAGIYVVTITVDDSRG
jgi:hypothetical protein